MQWMQWRLLICTACIEGPVTPYIHAVNAVEAFNTDIGTMCSAYNPHTQAAPISVLEAFTVSTAFTACIEGPVTLYIHALNAVDTVEASNNDLGYIYWKTHFILVGGI